MRHVLWKLRSIQMEGVILLKVTSMTQIASVMPLESSLAMTFIHLFHVLAAEPW